MKEVQNPMRGHSSQEEMMRIHNGFFEYLLEPNALGGKGPNGELLSEYKKIMYRVLPFLQAHPGFKLYVTGHSMGAALATLLAFGAATEPDNVIPKPVSLFSIGGPYVGDLSFRSAHQLLEGLGKLRHLRLSNFKDIVPIIPKISFRFPFHREDHVGTFFKHVGMNLRLYAGSSPMEFSYPRVRTGFFSSKFDEISRGWEQSFFANFIWNPMDFWTWPYHNLKEYSERVDAYKPILQTVQLNDLYTRKDIVGNLLAEF
jgi:Lipase (class 3)